MIVLKLALVLTLNAGPKDCGTDMKCFIKAAKTCAPSQVRNTVTMDLMGNIQKMTTLFVISGAAGTKCRMQQTMEKVESRMSDDAVKALRKQRPELSESDIRKAEADQNKSKQAIPKMPDCLFSNKALVDVMTRLRDGTRDSREWDDACPAPKGRGG